MLTRNIILILSSVVGSLLVVSGIVMSFVGVESRGVIDIKSAVISGKVETGSLGLLLIFLGVILLIVLVRTRREIKKTVRHQEKGTVVDWSRWETGDPYAELIETIFPHEEIPLAVRREPVVDWLSEYRIRELVDNSLRGELKGRTISFVIYHLQKDKLQIVEETIINTLENALNENIVKYDINNEVRVILSELFSSQVHNMLSMLHQTVESYFLIKKRIFAGWDKYPTCYPPIHNELVEWLENIENNWMIRINNVIKSYKSLVEPGGN